MLGPEVVRVQVEHSHHERYKNCCENHHEFKNVFHCSAQGDLQRSEPLAGRQDVRDATETQNHSDRIEALGNELRVRGRPVNSRWEERNVVIVSVFEWYKVRRL